MDQQQRPYGQDDASYQAAGGLDGITKLVDDFYDHMEEQGFSQRILHMHPADLTESRRKLAYFLSGWLGGPRLYQQHYGGIAIPMFHRHLDIGTDERDAWMRCMAMAVEQQDYAADFKQYLVTQLMVPAERIRMVAQRRIEEEAQST